MKSDAPIMKRQYGLSLIELMVALLLSTLLILGITQIYIDNKRNYSFQQGQSDNIENARYALLLLEEELYRVGYRTQPDTDFGIIFRHTSSGDCSFASAEVIKFDVNDQRLCIRYQPALPEITVCSGETRTGSTIPYDESIDPVIVELQVFNNALLCNGTPLIENMVDIKLSFGVNDDDTSETQRFTDTPAENDRITSVRYAVLLKSRSQTLADDNNSLPYRAWRAKWYSENNATAPDRAIYFTVENTVAIRN